MDRGYLVGPTPPTVLYRFFRNFTGVLVMVRRYACGLDIILGLFLSYIPQLNVHLSPSVLSISYQCLVPLSANAPTVLYFILYKASERLMSWPEDIDMLWKTFLSFVSVFCSSNFHALCHLLIF